MGASVLGRFNCEPFPATLDRKESDALVDRIKALMDERDYGLWAAELRETGDFIGFVGLAGPIDFVPKGPSVEIGWRLARQFWGKGLATEAAKAVLECAFGQLGLQEVISFTAACNKRSMAVMERIGMRRDPASDFDHPSLPEGHRLRRHVLYRKRP